jgi:hypothetical protein
MAKVCFWLAFGCAFGAATCLFAAFRAARMFCDRSNPVNAHRAACSVLNTALEAAIPVLLALPVISIWGVRFSPSPDNLRVALAFATSSAIMIGAVSVSSSVLLVNSVRQTLRKDSLEKIEIDTVSELL